jgi:lipopolysaccharide/colanic/teichoic acid biosynthesis glycosyltransferase
MDVVVAVVLLVLTSPLLVLTIVGIALTMGRPVFFTQQRTGLSGSRFRLVKLRTMRGAHDSSGRPLADSERLTAFGRLLRKSSIDELPELLNVIRGDMSLVGPRPLLTRYDQWYTETERLRFAARPGITGLAQINGRNSVGWDARLALDVRYVSDWSFGMDLSILARTCWQAATGAGVAVDPTAVMQDLDLERQCRA